MDDITIKHLLSRRFEYSSNRDTEFSHRIKSDHWFNSIDDLYHQLDSLIKSPNDLIHHYLFCI